MASSPIPGTDLPADHHHHAEQHKSHRAGWLRAAVLGANDGVVSTAALIVGVASSGASVSRGPDGGHRRAWWRGRCRWAVGEYVSVAAQRDTEEADLRMEAQALRGAPPGGAGRADADLGVAGPRARAGPGGGAPAHRGRRPGRPRPRRAGAHGGLDGAARAGGRDLRGGVLPRGAPSPWWRTSPPPGDGPSSTVVVALVALASLGALGATLGGASRLRATLRVAVGGAAAMGVTMLIGELTGATLG